ncbi:MAG TPA: elongation factor P [Syntrophorhabdaceae bacterium]|nr:elongation factor P [Syntrophorhabdaceae bacterium]
MIVSTSEFRKGLRILVDNEPFVIVDFQHVKPGKGGAFVRTRLKSLVSGNVLDRTYRSGDKAEVPEMEEKAMQFLYKEDVNYHFMDQNTYDQLFIDEKSLGDAKNYLKEGMVATILFYQGRTLGVDIQNFVELRIVQAEPGVKGDTAQNATKPAVLETGYTIQVPLFVEEGDTVRIDTRTGDYMDRVLK